MSIPAGKVMDCTRLFCLNVPVFLVSLCNATRAQWKFSYITPTQSNQSLAVILFLLDVQSINLTPTAM